MWTMLQSVISSLPGSFVILGDFNQVFCHGDEHGYNRNTPQGMNRFAEFVSIINCWRFLVRVCSLLGRTTDMGMLILMKDWIELFVPKSDRFCRKMRFYLLSPSRDQTIVVLFWMLVGVMLSPDRPSSLKQYGCSLRKHRRLSNGFGCTLRVVPLCMPLCVGRAFCCGN